MLKVHLEKKTGNSGKHITLRDLSNIGAKLKEVDHNDLARTVRRLLNVSIGL